MGTNAALGYIAKLKVNNEANQRYLASQPRSPVSIVSPSSAPSYEMAMVRNFDQQGGGISGGNFISGDGKYAQVPVVAEAVAY